MAAIQKAKRIHSVIPPGMEVNDRAFAGSDIESGDPIVISADAPPSLVYEYAVEKATGSECHGFALVTVGETGLAEYTTQNEMDGYTGLTPGAPLYVVDGELDDAEPADGGTIVARCLTTTRIRVLVV